MAILTLVCPYATSCVQQAHSPVLPYPKSLTLPVPWGFYNLLVHCWRTYAEPLDIPVIVYENGYAVEHESKMRLEGIIDDQYRQEFYDLYISAMLRAVKNDGVKMSGYHCWSLLE